MSDDLFDDPSAGDKFSPEEHEDRLLLVYPHSVEEGVQTDFGEKEAVKADIVVLDGPNAGLELKGGLVFPLVLQSQLKRNVGTGRPVVGRLGKGTAKKGQKPPWQLNPATDTDKSTARDYINRKPAVDSVQAPF